jgi:hypothetical protein
MTTQNSVNDLYLPLAGGTLTGNLILNADPVVALGAVTKQYADAIAASIDFKDAAYAASTTALTVTYSNGVLGVGATLTNAGAQATFAIDGVSPAATSRILIKNQASTFQNGIYTVTNVGSGSTNWVLTRSTDYNLAPLQIFPGTLVPVDNGTVNAITSWVETATVTTIGTDPITFSQFTAGPGANFALSNLASVAINTALIPGADGTIDLGSAADRFRNALVQTIQTGTTNAQTLLLQAYNTGGSSYTTFATLTAGATPTFALASAVTGVTQSAADNSTKLATTAYADAVGGGSGGLVKVATATAASSATIDFPANITSLYNDYRVTFENVSEATTGSDFTVLIGTGAGPTYSVLTYSGSQLVSTGTSSANSANGATNFILSSSTNPPVSTATKPIGGAMELFNANTANTKNMTVQCGYQNASAGINVAGSAQWTTNTVVTALRFIMSAGNIATGKFTLYGYQK